MSGSRLTGSAESPNSPNTHTASVTIVIATGRVTVKAKNERGSWLLWAMRRQPLVADGPGADGPAGACAGAGVGPPSAFTAASAGTASAGTAVAAGLPGCVCPGAPCPGATATGDWSLRSSWPLVITNSPGLSPESPRFLHSI